MPSVSGIKVYKGRDVFPSAVIIDWIGIMGGIQEKLFNMEFRKVSFHSEKGMQERKHIVPGSPFQQWKNREVIEGIGSHKHVEMVAEEIAFPVGIPAPVAVGL